MMRKIVVLFLAVMCLLLVGAGTSSAIQINVGPLGAKFSDFTYSDFDYINMLGGASGVPSHPGQTVGSETGNVWGVVSLTSVHSLMDGNPENNLLDTAYYNPGSDGKYYYGVFGGLTHMSDTGAGYPAEVRLGSVAGPMTNNSYLKIYEVSAANIGVYAADYLAGPNVAGAGAFGTFGLNIINAPGAQLWLDCVYSPGTMGYYDGAYQAGELELLALTNGRTGSAEAYLDIMGGTGAGLFQTGVFPLAFPGAPFRGDLKVINDTTALGSFGPGGVWVWNNQWIASSQDPITGVGVPEPATMILLGSGLIGLAGFGRRRLRKK